MPVENRQWLLVNALDPANFSIVAGGFKSSKNTPLRSFFRSRADRVAAMDAVADVERSGQSEMRRISTGRMAFAEPLLAPDGVVHGAWLMVGAPEAAGPDRPLAWAFTWNLDEGTASRVFPGEGRDANRPVVTSIAETFDRLDLGPSMLDVLAKVVAGRAGQMHHAHAVRRLSGEPSRLIQFHAKVCVEDETRLIRGFSHDLGPADPLVVASSIGDIVAAASTSRYQWRALVDLASLELICWYDDPPTDIAWRYDAAARDLRIHPEDQALAAEMANRLCTGAAESSSENVRFLRVDGGYVSYEVTASRVEVADRIIGLIVMSSEMKED